MKQVSVTYKAPPGDSKVVEMFGHTFYDGKAETVTVDDRMAEKLAHNPVFKCGEATDAKEAKADPKAEEAAAKAAKAADDAKRVAQGTSPPLRGVQLNPPAQGETPEPEDQEATKKAGFQAKPHETQAGQAPHQAGRDK